MYRRISFKNDTLVLRVILGQAGMNNNTESQALLLSLLVIRFLWWTLATPEVRSISTESKAPQFDLAFQLPWLARQLLRVMGWISQVSHHEVLWPPVTIAADPDFVVAKRYPRLELRLWSEDLSEYHEHFSPPPTAAMEEQPSDTNEGGQEGTAHPPTPSTPTHLAVVAYNQDVPWREPREVRQMPPWYRGTGDIRGDGERTDPFGIICTPTPTPGQAKKRPPGRSA